MERSSYHEASVALYSPLGDCDTTGLAPWSVHYFLNDPREPWVYPDLIEFYPGLNDGKFYLNGKLFDEYPKGYTWNEVVPKAKFVTSHKKWRKEEYDNHNENPHDFAGIILDKEIKSEKGYFQPLHHPDVSLLEKEVSVTGYPGEKDGDMYTMNGKIQEICNTHVHYGIDTSRGQSGSPVWYSSSLENGNHVSVAIHIGNHHGRLNTGTRLTQQLLDYMSTAWATKFKD